MAMTDQNLDERLRHSAVRLAERPLPDGLRERLLAIPAAAPARRRATRRGELAVALATAAVLGAVLAGAVLNHRVARPGPAPAGHPWHETVRVVVNGGPGGALGAAGGSAWLTTRGTTRLYRVDAATRLETLAATPASLLPSGSLPGSQSTVLVSGDSLWVATGNRLLRLDRRSGAVRASLPISDLGPTHAVISDGSTIWAASGDAGAVYRIDAATGQIVATIPVRSTPFTGNRDPGGLAALDGMIWVVGEGTSSIAGIDPRTDQVARTFVVPRQPSDIVAAGGSLWIASATSGRIDRVDPMTGSVTASISIAAPAALATSDDAVWTASGSTVERISVDGSTVTDRIDVHGVVFAVAGDGDSVWVGSGQEPVVSRITREG
jgi:streptogramin lyase